ncbi:hypothetical protein [Paenibacillus sonchi]|nr:hypothetical protein [Paenibacillus sonchi]
MEKTIIANFAASAASPLLLTIAIWPACAKQHNLISHLAEKGV